MPAPCTVLVNMHEFVYQNSQRVNVPARKVLSPWERVFGIEIDRCARCQGRLRVIASTVIAGWLHGRSNGGSRPTGDRPTAFGPAIMFVQRSGLRRGRRVEFPIRLKGGIPRRAVNGFPFEVRGIRLWETSFENADSRLVSLFVDLKSTDQEEMTRDSSPHANRRTVVVHLRSAGRRIGVRRVGDRPGARG